MVDIPLIREPDLKKDEPVRINKKLKRIDSGIFLQELKDISIRAPSLEESKKQVLRLKKQEMTIKGRFKIINKIRIMHSISSVGCYAVGLSKPAINLIKNTVMKSMLKSIKPIYFTLSILVDGWYIPRHVKRYLRMRKISKNFKNDSKVYLDELEKRSRLRSREKELQEELYKLKILRGKKNIIYQDREISIEELNDKIHKKQDELGIVKEYMVINELRDINKERIKKEALSVAYGVTALGGIVLTLANPPLGIAMLAAVLAYGSYIFLGLANKQTIVNKVANYLANIVKGIKGREMVYKIRDIKDIDIDFDVVRKSRLSGDTFLAKDYNILMKLSGKEEYKKIHSILSKMGNNFINMDEFYEFVNFVNRIKNRDSSNFLDERDKARAKVIINDLEKRVEEYKELLDSKDYYSIEFINGMYDAKIRLQDVESERMGNTWWDKILIDKYERLFSKFDEDKNVSKVYKKSLVKDTVSNTRGILKKAELKEEAKRESAVVSAEYVINMIKNLPERKKLMKDGKEISVEELNLESVDDRILLNEVYDNIMQYEHAKKFLSACKIGGGRENVNKLLEKIRNTESEDGIVGIRDELVKEILNN